MASEATIQKVCEYLKVKAADVIASRVDDVQVVIVLSTGHKYTVKLADLPKDKPKPAAPKRPAISGKAK